MPRRTAALHLFLERALRERLSLRGIARLFGVSVQTVLLLLRRLAQALPAFRHSVAPGRADDVLELDELHSFVHRKKQKRWLWIALCRRTRQVVAFAIGDRSEKACRRLFERLPPSYRRCASYSDFWSSYGKVFQTGGIVGGQGDRRDGARRALERHAAAASGALRPADALVLEDGSASSLGAKYFIWHYNLDCSINTF